MIKKLKKLATKAWWFVHNIVAPINDWWWKVSSPPWTHIGTWGTKTAFAFGAVALVGWKSPVAAIILAIVGNVLNVIKEWVERDIDKDAPLYDAIGDVVAGILGASLALWWVL